MNGRDDNRYRAATLYYLQGATMESIAKGLNVSRSTVSRLLAEARESGLVRITITDVAGSRSPLARELADAFGIRVHLVPSRGATGPAARLDQVARRAAGLFVDAVGDGQRIGVAWGVTMTAVTRHLTRRPLVDATVIQMNGSANTQSSGVPYAREILQSVGDAFESPVLYFPVPAFFDYVETRQAMWRERSVRHVLDHLAQLDLAIFGVGSLTGAMPSHVYAGGFLDAEEWRALQRDGVVGDVCTVLLREDGRFADIAANARATGLTPVELRRVPRRICVVADPGRTPAILGALRAGVATDLVIDEATARATVARL